MALSNELHNLGPEGMQILIRFAIKGRWRGRAGRPEEWCPCDRLDHRSAPARRSDHPPVVSAGSGSRIANRSRCQRPPRPVTNGVHNRGAYRSRTPSRLTFVTLVASRCCQRPRDIRSHYGTTPEESASSPIRPRRHCNIQG